MEGGEGIGERESGGGNQGEGIGGSGRGGDGEDGEDGKDGKDGKDVGCILQLACIRCGLFLTTHVAVGVTKQPPLSGVLTRMLQWKISSVDEPTLR